MNAVNPNSIRQLVMTMILAGASTKDIGTELQAKHPESAAAKKVSKHVGWYRARMKKDGLLPIAAKVTETVATA